MNCVPFSIMLAYSKLLDFGSLFTLVVSMCLAGALRSSNS